MREGTDEQLASLLLAKVGYPQEHDGYELAVLWAPSN